MRPQPLEHVIRGILTVSLVAQAVGRQIAVAAGLVPGH